MTFRATATITGIVTFALGLGYLLAGPLVLGRWGIEATPGLLLLGRRLGALYLGLSVMFLLSRSAPSSPIRTAMGSGTALSCLCLAAVGIHAWSARLAGRGILVSVAVELLIAGAFLLVLLRERRVPPVS
jgi:hypothetical protein